jgi:hypothetical protein
LEKRLVFPLYLLGEAGGCLTGSGKARGKVAMAVAQSLVLLSESGESGFGGFSAIKELLVLSRIAIANGFSLLDLLGLKEEEIIDTLPCLFKRVSSLLRTIANAPIRLPSVSSGSFNQPLDQSRRI